MAHLIYMVQILRISHVRIGAKIMQLLLFHIFTPKLTYIYACDFMFLQ